MFNYSSPFYQTERYFSSSKRVALHSARNNLYASCRKILNFYFASDFAHNSTATAALMNENLRNIV